MTFRAVRGDAAAAFRERALYPARELPHPAPHGAADGAARRSSRNGMRRAGSSRFPAPPRCRSSTATPSPSMLGLAESAIDLVENDVGGGFGARGEFYPEDFLIPFAARHTGRPVKWTEDRREHLMAMNHAREADCDVEIACTPRRHDPRPARRCLCGPRRVYAYQRRGRRAQCGAIHVRPLPHRQHPHRCLVAADQQDAVRHLPRSGPFRDRFLLRAAVRPRGEGSRCRPGRVPPAQSRAAPGDAVPARHHRARRKQGRARQRRLSRHARALSRRVQLGGEHETAGQGSERPLSRLRGRLLHRRGRRRA